MKKIIITVFALMSVQMTLADTLVIPSFDVSATDYFKFCSRPGYICTTNYFMNQFQLKKSDRFEQLITQLDLTDDAFLNQLPQWIQTIITTEPLSEEQAESLKDLCLKSYAITKSLVFKSLADTLNQALIATKLNLNIDNIDYSQYKNNQTYYLVFKKILNEDDYQKVKFKLGSIAVFRFSYNQKLISANSKLTYMMNGQCLNYQIIVDIPTGQQILPLFNDSCTLSDSLENGLSKTSQFISDNKSTIIWISLAAIAVIVSQKYEIELTF